MAHLLLVDHYTPLLRLLTEALTPLGHTIVTAQDGPEALVLADTHSIDLVITAFQLPQMPGTALITALHARRPTLPIIAMSGAIGPREAAHIQETLGLAACFPKPFDLHALRDTVSSLVGPALLITPQAA